MTGYAHLLPPERRDDYNADERTDYSITTKIRRYLKISFIYNAPMLVDCLAQPKRVFIVYYTTNIIGRKCVQWLQQSHSVTPRHQQQQQQHPFSTMPSAIAWMCERICPSFLLSYISSSNPFSWTTKDWHLVSLWMATGSVFVSCSYAWWYFRNALNERKKRHLTYTHLMNKDFSNIIQTSLLSSLTWQSNQYLDSENNDVMHMRIFKGLYPLIKSQYLDQIEREYNEEMYFMHANEEAEEAEEQLLRQTPVPMPMPVTNHNNTKKRHSISEAIELQLIQQRRQAQTQHPQQNHNNHHHNNVKHLRRRQLQLKQKLKHYDLNIVQFTAANAAWYSTKWQNMSIQHQKHRIIGAFLCESEFESESESLDKNQEHNNIQKQIHETVTKYWNKRRRMRTWPSPSVHCIAEFCKILCLTLKHEHNGEWSVIIGHRAIFRSFHTYAMEYEFAADRRLLDDVSNDDNDHNNYDNDRLLAQRMIPNETQTEDEAESAKRVRTLNTNERRIEAKTDSHFIHLGFGPKWFNFSVVVVQF